MVPNQFRGAEQSEGLLWLNSQAGEEKFHLYRCLFRSP